MKPIRIAWCVWGVSQRRALLVTRTKAEAQEWSGRFPTADATEVRRVWATDDLDCHAPDVVAVFGCGIRIGNRLYPTAAMPMVFDRTADAIDEAWRVFGPPSTPDNDWRMTWLYVEEE